MRFARFLFLWLDNNVRRGLVMCGGAGYGVAWRGPEWNGMVVSGLERSGAVLRGMERYGKVRVGLVW